MTRKINNWCDISLDPYSIEYRVKRWFMQNFILNGNCDLTQELMMLLVDNPSWYNNTNIKQCMDWMKGTYNVTVDREVVHHLLIDLTIRYTDILNVLKSGKIDLNEYVRECYL